MDKINTQLESIYRAIPFWKVLGVLASLELISFTGFEFAWLNHFVFALLVIGVGVLSLKNLRYGVYALFAELALGSKGYLFSVVVGSHPISIRLALFLVVFAASIVWMIRERRVRLFDWVLWKPYAVCVGALALAVLVGVLRHNGFSNIFFDANGYLYFGLAFPLLQSIRTRRHVHQLLAVILAASVVMMGETVVLLFLFSHLETFTYTLPEVYKWIRDTGVGEITRYPNGFVRVFFQSHIFSVYLLAITSVLLAVAGVGKAQAKQRAWWMLVGVFALSVLTVFLSYSRSFWVAIAAAAPLAVVWLVWKQRVPFKRLVGTALFAVVICALDYVVVIGVVNFPLPGHVGVNTSAALNDRASDIGTEAAAASRWQLVRPLFNASMQHPVLGSGFGKTITYKSSDPRVLAEHPDGNYPTYAFEWGYLDLWLKLGLVGVVAYAWFVIALCAAGYRRWKNAVDERSLVSGALLAVICLLGVHIFTPYLNHPLGIGWLLVAGLFFTVTYEHTS